MRPKDYNVYSGPPGTGKTTTMLDVVNRFLEVGSRPEDIGYLAFTTAAANEAAIRAGDQFRYDPARLKWFRTIHSMCFRLLGLTTERVFGKKHEKDCARVLGLKLSSNIHNAMDFTGTTLHDRALFLINLSRVTLIPVDELWQTRGVVTSLETVHRIQRDLKQYKEDNHLLDFNDMISRVLEDPSGLPALDLLIVDEAQDLAPLQRMFIEELGNRSKEVYVAGDDDQAIYPWAGADVDWFINLPGPSTVLEHSYRLPRKIHAVAEWVSEKIRVRRDKPFYPREEEGSVRIIKDARFMRVDLPTAVRRPGTKFIGKVEPCPECGSCDGLLDILNDHEYQYTCNKCSRVRTGEVSGRVSSKGGRIEGEGFTPDKRKDGTYHIDFGGAFDAVPTLEVKPKENPEPDCECPWKQGVQWGNHKDGCLWIEWKNAEEKKSKEE